MTVYMFIQRTQLHFLLVVFIDVSCTHVIMYSKSILLLFSVDCGFFIHMFGFSIMAPQLKTVCPSGQ